jgi:hypothetical protein
MFRFARGLLTAAIAIFLATMVPTIGHAMTYFFTQDGSGGKLGGDLVAPNKYGQVDVTTVGADLKFELTMDPSWFVDTGNAIVHHPVAFNLSVSNLKISATPGVYTAFAPPLSGVSGSGFTNPGFNGPFNYAINCDKNGANGCGKLDELTFYVLGAGGLSPVLTNGVFITADILSALTGKTGVVGATECDYCAPPPSTEVPVPGALPLFATGLAALGWLARRRRKQAA